MTLEYEAIEKCMLAVKSLKYIQVTFKLQMIPLRNTCNNHLYFYCAVMKINLVTGSM